MTVGLKSWKVSRYQWEAVHDFRSARLEGKQVGTLGQAANYSGGLELSPDGSRVATEEMYLAGNHEIWIRDVDRGVPSRFTFDPGWDREPHWSPDGSRLAFASDRRHGGRYSIYLKASSGSGNEEPLLDDLASSMPGAWSPDGKRLLYQRND